MLEPLRGEYNIALTIFFSQNTHVKWISLWLNLNFLTNYSNKNDGYWENKVTVDSWLSGSRLSGLFDYPDFFLWSRLSWILNSCHLEISKLKIDRLNDFKRLLKQRSIFVLKCDEKFLKQTNVREHFRVYECLHRKWIFLKNHLIQKD